MFRYSPCLLPSLVLAMAAIATTSTAQWSTNYWPATNSWWIRSGHIEELHAAINERTLASVGSAWADQVTNAVWIDRDYVEDAWDQLQVVAGRFVNTNKLGTGTTFNAYFATNDTWIGWTWTNLITYVTGTNVIHGMNAAGQSTSWYVRRDTIDDLRNCVDQLTHGWHTVSWGTSTNFVKIQYNAAGSPFTNSSYAAIQQTSRDHYTNSPPAYLNTTTDPDSTVLHDVYWRAWDLLPGTDVPGTETHGVIGQGVTLTRLTNSPLYSTPYAFNAYGTPRIDSDLSSHYECDADLYIWAGTNFVTADPTPDRHDGIPVDSYDSGSNTWPTSFTFTQTVTKATASTNLNWTGPYGDTSHAYPELWPASSNAFPAGFSDYGVGWNMRGVGILRWDSDPTNGFLYLP